MRKALAGLAAIGVIATCALPNGASADGPLVLKRNAVAKRPFDFEGKHIGVGLVLRSPGKGIVGTARIRCVDHINEIPRTNYTQRCSVKSTFSEGKVTARGLYTERDGVGRLPIVGGSGAFRRAKGVLISVDGKRRNSSVLTYRLKRFG